MQVRDDRGERHVPGDRHDREDIHRVQGTVSLIWVTVASFLGYGILCLVQFVVYSSNKGWHCDKEWLHVSAATMKHELSIARRAICGYAPPAAFCLRDYYYTTVSFFVRYSSEI